MPLPFGAAASSRPESIPTGRYYPPMEATFTSTPRISMAIAMVMQAHATQFRMGTALPYVVHPIGVAMALVPYGDENLVLAGLLHDAPEDTDLSLKKIRGAFGDDVAWLVETVTHLPGESKMDRAKIICASGLRPVRLKLADNGHNLSDLDPSDRKYPVYMEIRSMLLAAESAYVAMAA